MIFCILALIGLFTVWTWFWQSKYFREDRPDSIFFTETEDGWRLTISKYNSTSAENQQEKSKLPIILCHGIGSSALCFDATPATSFSRRLTEAGHDVYAVDLRGHGLSEKPGLFGKSFGWSFDTHVDQDTPALIKAVCKDSGHPQVHWIGLSMGGNILYTYLAKTKDSRIGRSVTLASSLDYSQTGSSFDLLSSWTPLIKIFPAIPHGHFGKLLSPFLSRFETKIDKFFFWPKNVRPEVTRKIYANAHSAISTPVLIQKASLFQPGGLLSADGTTQYFSMLPAIKTPILAIAGDKDLQCPPAAVERTYGALGSVDKKLVTLGQEHGQQEHYGHLDLVTGTRVGEELIPKIVDWLDSDVKIE